MMGKFKNNRAKRASIEDTVVTDERINLVNKMLYADFLLEQAAQSGADGTKVRYGGDMEVTYRNGRYFADTNDGFDGTANGCGYETVNDLTKDRMSFIRLSEERQR